MKLTRNKKFNNPKPLKFIRKEDNNQSDINEIQDESSFKSQSEEENKIQSESINPFPKEEDQKKSQNILSFNLEEGLLKM